MTPERRTAADVDPLAARLRAGDAAALDVLYRRHAAELRAAAYRVARSREAAVEIVHDVFLALWRGRLTLDVRGGMRAYLYRAARNRALDWVARERVRRRWGEREVALAEPAVVERDALVEAEEAAVLRAVLAAIEAMPERRRVVCSLRWREGRSLAEIAASLGIAQKTVETQLSRGLKELRGRFRAG